MLFNRDEFRLEERYNIKLQDHVLQKLEDGYKNKEELLITVDASHYGMLNGNLVVYRHDTVRNNIGTFIHPNPKPIIMNHRPQQSKQFGRVIAVDYKPTEFYDQFMKLEDSIDDLSTLDYLNFCKDKIIPFQKANPNFNGLGYCEVVGKIEDKEGIKKVLEGQFLAVSIGADPKRLICSHCLQDQVVSLCDHYADRKNGLFMLAEDLEYEEMSFLTAGKKPADPFGKVTRIHDGQIETYEYELNTTMAPSVIDVINARDFFKLADETKTIVCVDNICKVINNQEDNMARKAEQKPTFNVAYGDEFSTEEISALKLTDNEEEDTASLLVLTDEAVGNLKNSDFAIVQKTEDGIKRRFPVHTTENVKAAAALLDSAKDLTPSEVIKAKATIEKAAKKLGVEVEFKSETEVKGLTDAEINTEEIKEEDTKTLEAIVTELKTAVQAIEASKLQDAEVENPITVVIKELASLTDSVEWVKASLTDAITAVLEADGLAIASKEEIEAAKTATESLATLQDELTEAKEEIELLDELNRDLNVQVRKARVDEIVESKSALGLIKDSVEEEAGRLNKLPYDVLSTLANEHRELKTKLSDNVVNNKQASEIKTVENPTLTDSEADEESKTQVATLEDEKKPSYEETVNFIKSLFGN